MQGKEVEGLPVENAAPAANEEFASPEEGVDGLASKHQSNPSREARARTSRNASGSVAYRAAGERLPVAHSDIAPKSEHPAFHTRQPTVPRRQSPA